MAKRDTILIVEDNEISRMLLKEQLDGLYDILLAENGQVGIDLLRENTSIVSLILLDIDMPVMNGYEFMEAIKQEKEMKSIPVIITTSNDNAEVEDRCLELGASDFLGKPFDTRRVVSRVKNLIRNRETAKALHEMERDDLTGLYNKKAFLKRAEKRISENPDKQFGIFAMDVENFKLSNTLYGEERCDNFLRFLAGKLIEYKRNMIIGRFSGDQFVILFELTPEYQKNPGEILVKGALDDAPIPHQKVKVGIYAPIDTNLPLVRSCDRAFVAIREIKGVYGEQLAFYNDAMTQKLVSEQLITDSMEVALKENQFMIYYQPKHNCLTGKIAGCEALVRWIHPTMGFMNPGQFIPLFEKNGFVTELDSFVINQVCRDIKDWERRKLPVVPVSVNISRRDLLEEQWMDRQMDLIDSYDVDHSLIHMEVTESLYAENTEFITEQVKKIQDRGFLIEMDDFGSGYSSLGMLASCPLDLIKLDISFVRQIEKYEIIIENVVKLAHRMGFKTVAEGAETENQFMILRRLGCDFIQGYYFSKPLPVEEYEKYLVQNTANNCMADKGEETIKRWDDITAELEIKNTLLDCIDSFASSKGKDDRINHLLTIVGKFYNSERAYIFVFDKVNNTVRNTYEWCNKGIAADIDNLQALDASVFAALVEQMHDRNEFFVRDIAQLEKTMPALYPILLKEQVKSFMTAPIRKNGEIVGFMGVDNPAMHTDTLDLIHSVISFASNEING